MWGGLRKKVERDKDWERVHEKGKGKLIEEKGKWSSKRKGKWDKEKKSRQGEKTYKEKW